MIGVAAPHDRSDKAQSFCTKGGKTCFRSSRGEALPNGQTPVLGLGGASRVSTTVQSINIVPPSRPHPRYCSIAFQAVSSVHGTGAPRMTQPWSRPFRPTLVRFNPFRRFGGRVPDAAKSTESRSRGKIVEYPCDEGKSLQTPPRDSIRMIPVSRRKSLPTVRAIVAAAAAVTKSRAELLSRGRSIQPGRLCYNNGGAVEVFDFQTAFLVRERSPLLQRGPPNSSRASVSWTFDTAWKAMLQ